MTRLLLLLSQHKGPALLGWSRGREPRPYGWAFALGTWGASSATDYRSGPAGPVFVVGSAGDKERGRSDDAYEESGGGRTRGLCGVRVGRDPGGAAGPRPLMGTRTPMANRDAAL